MLWRTASAVPWNHSGLSSVCSAASTVTKAELKTSNLYVIDRCLLRLSELYCVSTKMRRRSELRQLLIGMSISRYLPPIGTAGFERWCVSGKQPRPAAAPEDDGEALVHAPAFCHARARGCQGGGGSASLAGAWTTRRARSREARPGCCGAPRPGPGTCPPASCSCCATRGCGRSRRCRRSLAVAARRDRRAAGPAAGAARGRPPSCPSRAASPSGSRCRRACCCGSRRSAPGRSSGSGSRSRSPSPLLEQLSRRVEARARGLLEDASPGLRFEVGQSLRGALYFLLAAPVLFLLGFVPIVGPLLSLMWGARAVALQMTDPALARRGMSFADKRRWHREWRVETQGFGLAGMLGLIVPLANLLLGPALVTGGTLLVLELEDAAGPRARDDGRGSRRERVRAATG